MNKGIQQIFHNIPSTYELINHILTFGLDIYWRRKLVDIATKDGGTMWLDVCTGTGETALYLYNRANKCKPETVNFNLQKDEKIENQKVNIIAVDFSLPMLSKAKEKWKNCKIKPIIADVCNLPFPNETFDLITISFATRNINITKENLISSLKEFYRVLKPNGRFINLETSQPKSKLIRFLFHTYIKLFVERIGGYISGSYSSYKYLSNTIPRFYSADEFAKIIRSVGFKNVKFKQITLGTSAIHLGIK